MSYDYYVYPPKGTEAGGGSGFPAMRICSGGQTQPQDPKQQQQQVQSGIPMSFTQQTRPPAPLYPRQSPRLNAPRPTAHMISQQIANTNLQYSAPMIIPPPHFPQTMLVPTPITSGRHQSHAGGQGAGSGGAPTNVGYYTHSQQQIFMQHHAPIPAPAYPYSTGPYMYQMRNGSYPTQNAGPHPGAAVPQPPQHQPQQQYVVDSSVRGGGAGSGGGGVGGQTGGVMMPPSHLPPQPTQPQPRQRRRNAIPIVNPNSGKDITDELFSENNSGESSASATPHPSFPHSERENQEVAAEFAAKVAVLAAVPPTEVVLQPVPSPLPGSLNGPSSSPPPVPPAPTTPVSLEIQPPPIAPPVAPQPPSQPPQALTQPLPPQATLVHPPPVLQPPQQIPTVSAKTDSPTVDIPRTKVPTHSPLRKSTPIPSAVQPVLDSKKKEKKATGLGSTLPPHREEPEEVRKSSFAETFNIKNITPIQTTPASQLPPLATAPAASSAAPAASDEPETNGEPEEIAPKPATTSALPTATAPLGGKHHDKQDLQSHQAPHGGKQLPKKNAKSKKSGGMKEQNRRWLDKEGGSDMDAFMGAGPPPTPASSERAASSPPPPAAVIPSPVAEPPTALSPPPQPSPTSVAPQSAAQPPTQLPCAPERQPSPQPPPQPTPPLPPVSNKNVTNNDEPEEMDEEEEIDEESLNVAAKNEENNKVSAAAAAEDEESIANETTLTDKSKPVLKYTYKEGQWSPLNPEGKKVYDREFLLILRSDDLSTKRPDIEDCDIIKTDSTNNNSISANNNNNRRLLHGSNSMNMNREFAPNYLRSSSSQRGGGMMSKRGSQQGRPSRDGRSKGGYTSSQQFKDAVDGELHWASKGGGWKPERCKTPPKVSEEEIKTENLYKRVRGILNKLTPQKFDTLMEQILELPIDTIGRLEGVVGLVFEKAVDEPSFSRAYAKLCQNLNKLAIKSAQGESNPAATDIFSFRKILLTKCQDMFEKKNKEESGEDGRKSDEERITELQQQIASEEQKDKKKEMQLILEEEERKIRVKYVGLARFIGELFKLQMLTSKIMFRCIKTLLERIEEESLECLCKLLSTVGKELEMQSKSEAEHSKELDDCFARMKKLSQKSKDSKVSSRVRFMLQDVIELRGNKWVPRREDNNPKTMEQIQRDAERETMMANALLQSSNTPRSKHSDRGDDRRRGGPRGGGGSSNTQDSDGWISTNKFRSYNTFEASKLQHIKGMDSEPATQNLGSYGQFKQWHSGSNAGSKIQMEQRRGFEYSTTNKFALLGDEKKMPPMSRKTTPSSSQEKERAVQSVREVISADRANRNQNSNPPSRDSSRARSSTKPSVPQSPAEPETLPAPIELPPEPEDLEVIKKKSKVLFKEWLANHNVQESLDSITEAFPEPIAFVKAVMDIVMEEKETQRIAFGELLSSMLSVKIVTALDVARELGELIEVGEDLMIDLPFIWKYLAEFLVPIMSKGVFTFAELKVACQECRTIHLTVTLSELITRLLKEKGPRFIKTQWETSKVKFSDFIPENEVDNFIKKHNFGFILGEGEVEAKEPVVSMTEVENILCKFLIQDGDKVFDHVCEWVKANVGSKSQDVDFIKALIRAVIKVCIKNDKIVPASLNKHSTLIKKFVDANELRELACLNGIMHLVVVEMESPQGLLLDIFQTLNDNNIISYEAFMKWKNLEKELGVGVAMASLSSFFVSLSEQDESDEEST